MSLVLLLAAGSIAAVLFIGMRDHHAAKAARRALLDGCVEVLDTPELSHAADGFPRLSGRHRGRFVLLDLICDTMTVRRLPQLWLSTTLIAPNAGLPHLGILVRPAGTEFYSLTAHFEHRLEAPHAFPAEVLIRGDAGAERLLAALTETLIDVLADARIKEIVITDRGLRIVRQAGEGKRGEHLLLRQSVFEDAAVPRHDVAMVLDRLQAMRATSSAYGRAQAA